MTTLWFSPQAQSNSSVANFSCVHSLQKDQHRDLHCTVRKDKPVTKLKTELTLVRMMSSNDSMIATTDPILSRAISMMRFKSKMSFNWRRGRKARVKIQINHDCCYPKREPSPQYPFKTTSSAAVIRCWFKRHAMPCSSCAKKRFKVEASFMIIG